MPKRPASKTTVREATLRRFYTAVDAQDWEAASGLLDASCRWHILATGATDEATLNGPRAIRDWLQASLGSVATSQAITRFVHEGPVAVAFTEATVSWFSGTNHTKWIDLFRFTENDLIIEHASLQIE